MYSFLVFCVLIENMDLFSYYGWQFILPIPMNWTNIKDQCAKDGPSPVLCWVKCEGTSLWSCPWVSKTRKSLSEKVYEILSATLIVTADSQDQDGCWLSRCSISLLEEWCIHSNSSIGYTSQHTPVTPYNYPRSFTFLVLPISFPLK